MENNGSYSVISENEIPPFSDPSEQQLVAFENDKNFSTYRITFLNNQSDFNESKAIEIAEIDLLGVPDSDQWLSTSPVLHLGGQANQRILSVAPGSWRFNGGEVNYTPVEPNTVSLQVWSRQNSSDYNGSKFFLNGAQQNPIEIINPEQFPLDTNPFTSIGGGFSQYGSFRPFDGKIGEIIVLEDASEDTRLKFEGYLAHKWGLSPKLPEYHPYKAQFNAIYHPPTPINKIKDRSGNNNDAFQIQENFKPGLIFNALNGRNVIQLDGNDFLNFTEDENFIRTMFMVYKRSSGNRGYLLGHDYENAFQSGASSIWDQSWGTIPYFF